MSEVVSHAVGVLLASGTWQGILIGILIALAYALLTWAVPKLPSPTAPDPDPTPTAEWDANVTPNEHPEDNPP